MFIRLATRFTTSVMSSNLNFPFWSGETIDCEKFWPISGVLMGCVAVLWRFYQAAKRRGGHLQSSLLPRRKCMHFGTRHDNIRAHTFMYYESFSLNISISFACHFPDFDHTKNTHVMLSPASCWLSRHPPRCCGAFSHIGKNNKGYEYFSALYHRVNR